MEKNKWNRRPIVQKYGLTIELRRAKERAAPVNLTKETPPVRQYVQVNVVPGRDNLPPPPDYLIKDAPINSE